MICFPNAKINIGLNVTEKRSDGFHNIETIFYPVNLCDILEFVEKSTPGIDIAISGLPVAGKSEENLVHKVYNLLLKKYSIPGLSVHLHKIIPMGAGLGGGSSNAAFFIKNLNTVFNLTISEDIMEEYSSEIGSDCAFFIKNKPVFAYEKGNKFKEIDLTLSLYKIVIIHPGIHVNTADAYSSIKPCKPEFSLIDLIEKPVKEWKEYIRNDFEITVFKRYPEIESIKNKLYEYGAEYASMSGSGSAVYGLFHTLPEKLPFPDNYFKWEGKIEG